MWSPLTNEEQVLLRIALARKRTKQARAHSTGTGKGSAVKLNRRRAVRQVLQRHRKRLTKGRTWRRELAKVVLARKYRANPILDAIYPERRRNWVGVLDRNPFARVTIDIPSLSFFRDPVDALQKLADIAAAEALFLDVRVNFTFDHCEDIGPILLMAEAWPAFLPVFSGGHMKDPVQKVIEAVGLGRALKMKFPGLTDLDGVFAMPIRRRRPSGSSVSETRDLDVQSREIVQDGVCDHIDEWLEICGSECALSDMGRSNLSATVGEILDNAERHSSYEDKDGSWSVAGVMSHRETDNGSEFRCLLTFLSIGATIAESLEATAPPAVKAQLDVLLSKLVRSAGATQARSTLLTLAAVQDGVTRDPEAFVEDRGGTGLLDVVEFVQMLGAKLDGSTDAEIVLISGNSCISLRSPYMRGLRLQPDEGRRIWFNKGNTTDEAPSLEHVRDLPFRVPGTIISVAFTLEPEFFRSIVDG